MIFLLTLILFLVLVSSSEAQIYHDYRSDYRTIPSHNKTVQFLVGRDKNRTIFYFKQNLGFSNEPSAFIIPIKGESPKIEVAGDSDPLNDILNKYDLFYSYSLKKVDYAFPPKVFNSSEKDKLYGLLIQQNIDISDLQRNQIDDWFKNDAHLVLLVTNPVQESRVTWTKPLKVMLTQNELSLPLGWLKSDSGILTSNKRKIIYAENFEGGNGGWQDEYQGRGANSLVTRDSSEKYGGNYSLKVTNKEGSINAMTTQTIGGLTPGEHYTFSAYFKPGTVISADASLRVMGSGLIALSSGLPVYNGQNRNWSRISITFKARSAFHFFSLMAGGESGQYVYWDNIQIEKGTEATGFRNDLVGKTTETSSPEDLVSSQVNFQALLLGSSPFKAPAPFITSNVYKFSDKNTTKLFSSMPIAYMTQISGLINPEETSQFLVIETTDVNSVQINNLLTRKIQEKVIIGLKNYMANNLLLFITIVAALIIRYVLVLLIKMRESGEKSILPTVLYASSWLINVISLLFLVSFIYTEVVQPSRYPTFFNSYQVFIMALFFTSIMVYIPALWYMNKSSIKAIKNIIEVQLGICLTIFIIVLSLIFTDVLKIYPTVPTVSETTSSQLYQRYDVKKYSKVPALILIMLEAIILYVNVIRVRKHIERKKRRI